MNKLKEKYKIQKGITSIDCVVSIIIIVTMLEIIITICNNAFLNLKNINRRAEATRIIVNIAENLDAIYYSTFEEKYNSLVQINENERYFVGTEGSEIFNTEILPGYIVYLLKVEEDDEKTNIKLRVEYTVNNIKKDISLTKILDKEGT